MSDKKDIDDAALKNGVDLKPKKISQIKKEDKKKLKKRKKQAIKLRKSRRKKSFLGFSGRLSLVFLVIVMIFTSTLYSFIYLNNRLDLLRNDKAKTTEMLLSWETLNNATNRLLVRSGIREKIEAVEIWGQLYKDFEPAILDFISADTEEEAADIKESLTMRKRINLLVDDTMNYLLNYIYKQRIILEDTYQANLRTNRNIWYLVKTRLDGIKDALESEEIINFIENNETSFSVEYGKRLVQGNISDDFFYAIDSLTGFYTISQQFATQLQYTIDLLDSDINLKTRFINILMAMMANVISVIAFIFTIVFFFYLRGSVIKPLNWLIRETERIGRGDLTGKIQTRRSDEIGTLTTAFNTTVTDLKTLIQQIYVAIIVITKTLRTLFKSSNDVKESANAQATTIENTRENFEKLDSMIKTISEETTKANKYTEESLNKTKIGLSSIEDLEKEMTKIETSSEEITDIINLINYIAEQTELLSINASIEAARAGEYGKGFSVVANEIKQLAERSTQSANRIYELITYNSKIIQGGVNLSRATAELLKEIAMSTEISAGIVKTINEESNKIQVSSNEILGVINYISEVAQVNLLEIENVATATVDLGEQSVKLQRFIGQFDARSEKIKENQAHIEQLLHNKLEIAMDIIRTLGGDFFPTGNKVEIKVLDKRYIADELKLGENVLVTFNNDFVDNISERTNTSVSFFQNVSNEFVRVSTTIKNYDETRALGTMIPEDSEVYHAIINKESFYGRIFIVNRWYISIYEPILDQTGNIIGIINLAIPEEMDVMSEAPGEKSKEDSIKKEKILTA